MTRVAADYTAEELAALRDQVKPEMDRYRRRRYLALYGVVGFLLSLALSWLGLDRYFLVLGPTMFIAWVYAIAMFPSNPACPACHNKPSRNLGPFCPECGQRALRPGDWLHSPKCDACGKKMSHGKHRSYQIRFCSHCGVMLDEEGF